MLPYLSFGSKIKYDIYWQPASNVERHDLSYVLRLWRKSIIAPVSTGRAATRTEPLQRGNSCKRRGCSLLQIDDLLCWAVFLSGAMFSAFSSCDGANFETQLWGFLVAGTEVKQSASARLKADAGAERLWIFVLMCWAQATLWTWKVSIAAVILIFRILQLKTGGNSVSSMPWRMPCDS